MTIFTVVRILVLCICMTACEGASSPVLVWPLCHVSFSYDIVEAIDGEFPKLTDCFEIDDGSKFTPTTSNKALYFNGSTQVFITPKSDKIPSSQFGVSMFVKPKVHAGTLFRYKSTQASSQIDLLELSLLADGRLSLKLEDGSGNLKGSVVGHNLPLDDWTLIQFGLKGSGECFIKTNANYEIKEPSTSQMKTPGQIWIGTGYVGSAICVLLFDDASSFPSMSETNSYCDDSNSWGKKPGSDYTAPSCLMPPSPMTTTATTQSPSTTQRTTTEVNTTPPLNNILHAWPLNNQTLFGEVITGTYPEESVLSLCSMKAYVHQLPYIYFDGSVLSRAVVNLNTSFLQDSFTITMMILPEVNSSGTLLNIHGSYVSGLSRVLIYLGLDNVSFSTYSANGDKCADVKSTSLQINSWNILIVSRNKDTNSLNMKLNNEDLSESDSCVSGSNVEPITVYIGDSIDYSDPFRGFMRCVLVYSGVVVTPNLEADCESFSSTNSPVDTCDQVTRNQEVYFRKVANNVKPEVSKEPINVLVTKTSRWCAGKCAAEIACRSFVYVTTNNSCILYDFVTKYGLVYQEYHHFYSIVRKVV